MKLKPIFLNPVHQLPSLIGAIGLLGISACSSSSSTTPTTSVVANMKITSAATKLSLDSDSSDLTAGGAAAGTGGLTSLKYFITSIQICQSMTTTGTAFSAQSGCFTLYSGPTDATLNPSGGAGTSPDYKGMSTYAASTTTGYIDLMSTASRATIATGGTVTGAASAGSYNYGLVNWAYPVKVTATIPVGASYLYTQATTVTNSTTAGGAPTVLANTVMTTSPAAEAIVPLSNGGTWFKFQNPFVISDADVSAGTAYTVDLTFNPDNLIRGFKGPNAPTNLALNDGVLGATTTNAVNVPMLDLSPVPRKSTDSTYVETYTTTSITGTTDTFSLRLELYYNSADTTKSIYGATLRVIPTSTTQFSTDIAKIAFIAANATTATNLDFQDYATNPIVKGFTRQTAVGGTTTVTLPCTGTTATSYFSAAGCASGSSVTATFKLASISSL